jgi:L-2,4-diaminobutyric acid acetyltransferase
MQNSLGGSDYNGTETVRRQEVVTKMNNRDEIRNQIHIRAPRLDDIAGIITVVRTCGPFLTAHASYIYWMDIHLFCKTCAVAEVNDELVGWCSVRPVSDGRYFLHQLGVAPCARGRGLAGMLVTDLLKKLRVQQPGMFELEFTVDRKNGVMLGLFQTIADRAGMRLQKKPNVIQLPEEGCNEELYVMTPTEASRESCKFGDVA